MSKPDFIDAKVYTDRSIFDREISVIKKQWLLACHESEVSKPGDYYVFERMGASLIITRNEAGSISVFSNSCAHRGSHLLEGRGRCKTIHCAYHGWRYDLDGKLQTPNPDELKAAPKGLAAVAYKLKGGFVWVSPAKQKDDFGSDTLRYFDLFDTANMRVRTRRVFRLSINYKSYIENICDSYHIKTLHNALLNKLVKVDQLTVSPEGRNLVLQLPIADFKWRKSLDAFLSGGRSRKQPEAYCKVFLFPNTVINFTAVNVTVYNVWPVAEGETEVEYSFLQLRSRNPLTWLRNLIVFVLSLKINREDNVFLPKYHRALLQDTANKRHLVLPEYEQSIAELSKIFKRHFRSKR